VSVTSVRPVFAGKFTARPLSSIGCFCGSISVTEGSSSKRNSYCIANDSAEVATSTCAWPGMPAWFGAMHGTASGQGEPSSAMYFAIFAARASSPRYIVDTEVPRE
jgi:hypothetical protein